ncbi:MAG: hypothetical protein C0397_17175 [Odoribacter sp.]|nr:hypothetical protein [Odoribacter sp.]
MGLIPGIGLNAFMGVTPSYGKYRVFMSSYKIWVSNDYGSTWASTASQTIPFGNDCKTQVSDSGQYMLAHSYYAGIWLSTNYGASFTQIGSGGYTWSGAAMSRSGQYMYKLSGQNFYKSTDYGSTWGAPVALGVTPTAGALACSGNGAVIVAPVGGTYNHLRSTNYGAGWSGMSFTTFYPYSFALSNDGRYIMTSGKPSQGIIPEVSSDYGNLFTQTSGIGSAYSRCAVSASGQYMLVGYNSNIYKSSNYGVTWTSSSMPGAWTNSAMSEDGSVQFVISNSGGAAKSTDYGTTWSMALEHQDWLAYAANVTIF